MYIQGPIQGCMVIFGAYCRVRSRSPQKSWGSLKESIRDLTISLYKVSIGYFGIWFLRKLSRKHLLRTLPKAALDAASLLDHQLSFLGSRECFYTFTKSDKWYPTSQKGGATQHSLLENRIRAGRGRAKHSENVVASCLGASLAVASVWDHLDVWHFEAADLHV